MKYGAQFAQLQIPLLCRECFVMGNNIGCPNILAEFSRILIHTISKNNFKKWVDKIQIVGYNGTITVLIIVANLKEAAFSITFQMNLNC